MCTVCGKTFSRYRDAKMHVLRLHTTDNQESMCPFCGRSYLNIHKYNSHLYSVHGIKPQTGRFSVEKRRKREMEIAAAFERAGIAKPDNNSILKQFGLGKNVKQELPEDEPLVVPDPTSDQDNNGQ